VALPPGIIWLQNPKAGLAGNHINIVMHKIIKYIKNFYNSNANKKCSIHSDISALNICNGCKKYYCKNCLTEGPQYYYCASNECRKLYLQELDYANSPRFCQKCISETTEESSGDIVTVNGIFGENLYDETHRDCPICGAVTCEKVGTFGRYKASYKVIWLNDERTKFISRKIK